MAWVASNTVANTTRAPAAAPGAAAPRGGRASALSMYAAPPEGEIALEEFERFALDRLKGEEKAGDGAGARAAT